MQVAGVVVVVRGQRPLGIIRIGFAVKVVVVGLAQIRNDVTGRSAAIKLGQVGVRGATK